MARRNPNRHRQAHTKHLKDAKQLINRKFSEMQLNGGVEQVTDLFTGDSSNRTFNSIDEIINDIKKRVECGVQWATRIVFLVADVAVENWYNDYDPEKYKRTDVLYDNYVVWNSGSYASAYHGQVEVNPNYLSFTYPQSQFDSFAHTGSLVLAAAEHGHHGAEYPRDGKTGVGIWSELIGFIYNNDWGSGISADINGEFGDSQIVDAAFEVGVYTKKKVNAKFDNVH